jgi:hypothetical protein
VIDLPVNKALIAEERKLTCGEKCQVDPDYKCPTEDCCRGCVALDDIIGGATDKTICGLLCCFPENRKDGKNVVYKIIDVKD